MFLLYSVWHYSLWPQTKFTGSYKKSVHKSNFTNRSIVFIIDSQPRRKTPEKTHCFFWSNSAQLLYGSYHVKRFIVWIVDTLNMLMLGWNTYLIYSNLILFSEIFAGECQNLFNLLELNFVIHAQNEKYAIFFVFQSWN